MPNPLLPLDDHDRRIVSHELNAEAPWLDPEEPVTLGHVLRAAASRHGDPGAAGSRLAELGYRVPSPEELASATDDDRKMISRDIDGSGPWIGPGNDGHLRGHVLAAALRLNRPPAEIAARLVELGHPAPAPDSFPERVLDEDRDLIIHRDRTSPRRWIADDTLVTLGHVIAVLQHMGKLTRVPQQTVLAIAAVCERFTRLGYRVAPGAAEVTVDDVVLTSVGLDGCTPWLLDPDEPVPLHHVLRFAQAHDRDPNEVVARLGRLGYRRLPEGPLAGSVDREEVGLLGHGGNGKTWLAQEDPAWFPHLVAVGVETGRAPAEVADRLRALGFTIPEQELPAEVLESDLPLVSGRDLTGAGPWLSRTDPVPVGHILYSAHARDASVASVLARLAKLGYPSLPDVPDRHVTEDDLRLISERGDGAAPVLGDTVPYGRVLRAAAVSDTGPREIADRYRELGYTDVVLPDGPLPESVTERDADLVTIDTGWLAPDEAVPLPHVVQRAHAEGVGPAGIARRLHALGFPQVPAPLPDTPHPGDLVMISKDAKPDGPYIPSTGVPEGHIQRAADAVGVNPHEVAVRLAALGYPLEFTPHPDDAVIVSESADGQAPWPRWSALGRVLLAAKVLGRTPEGIVDRRRELGYREEDLPDAGGFEEQDILLLSENLDARGPWIGSSRHISLQRVLRAARITGRSPQQIGERLTLLGREVHVPPALDVRDNDLLEALPRYGKPVKTEHVLAAASRAGRSPAEAAARLRELDIEVPDLDYPTRRPAPTPPRLP
ncbi:wHTH domain-containing protein [Streptomyces hirsutus]|uniref:wHTH domain-containing protein n=1 Tax=Streptomyces hirsutus TaxID=35620 RepID=UPI0033B9C367